MKGMNVTGARPAALSERITECHFDRIDPDISVEHFAHTGEFADALAMLAVTQDDLGGSDMTTAEIEAAIDRRGYRRATGSELLDYVRAKWNGKDTVAALDSCVEQYVLYVYGGPDRRALSLRWVRPHRHWGGHVRFLVVPK